MGILSEEDHVVVAARQPPHGIERGADDAPTAKDGGEGEEGQHDCFLSSLVQKQSLCPVCRASRNNRVQMYTADADTTEAPQLFAGQDPLRANTFAVPSPDGKQLLVVSRKPPPAKGKAAKNKNKQAE